MIGILLIATNKYKQFVRPLIDSLDKHFIKTRKLKIYLFTDEDEFYVQGYDRIKVQQTIIPSYKFPYASLYRYKVFTSRNNYYTSHLFYMDVDMKVVADVGDEILSNGLLAVRHPGFDKVGGGSWGNNPKSTSYTLPSKRHAYYAGGFQGGKIENYYALMQLLKENIAEDERNGIMAEWHDETHFNKALSELKDFKVLNSSYCMPEQPELRKKWKINDLAPKIIALEKDHHKIRL